MASATPAENSASDGKDSIYTKMSSIFSTRTAATCCTYFLSHIKPTDRILDIGCGPGSITIGLARLVPQGTVVAFDVSPDFLNATRAVAEEQGLTNIEFAQGDAHAMPEFEDESFDIVHSNMVLMHLPRPVDALREMRRLAKSGGIVAARDCAANCVVPGTPILQAQMLFMGRMIKSGGGDMDRGRYTHVLAREAGFDPAKIATSSSAEEYSGPLRAAWIAGMTAVSMRNRAIAGGVASEEEMDEAERVWDEWGRDEGGRIMLLNGQTLCSK